MLLLTDVQLTAYTDCLAVLIELARKNKTAGACVASEPDAPAVEHESRKLETQRDSNSSTVCSEKLR
jgi:hypothetical protein